MHFALDKQRISAGAAGWVPPLANGYHLSRDEFERRYDRMPDVKRAELIEGIVFLGSPVSVSHGEPHARIMALLGYYAARTPLVRIADNVTYRVDEKNEFQPDAALFIDETAGGKGVIPDMYLEGAPELVCEIALSSYSQDLFEKKDAYYRAGVKEYLVWEVEELTLTLFRRGKKGFSPSSADSDSLIRSAIFPGLWINAEALITGQVDRALDDIDSGLRDSGHTEFKTLLQKRAARNK